MNQPLIGSPVSIGDRVRRDPQGPRFDLAVADASWIWTERLFTPLADLGVRVLLIRACDWRTALAQGRPPGDWLCPSRRLAPNLWEQTFILPPGWMKTYPRLGMAPIASAVRAWHRGLNDPAPLSLAISYPHYLHLRDKLQPDSLLYYNMDDYTLYWRGRSRIVQSLERQAVIEADLSVFCASIRAQELTQALPAAADRIVHLPHGAPATSIPARPLDRAAPPPPDLAAIPGPRLGFVGSLEDRIDWTLIESLARGFPHVSIVLVGRKPAPAPGQGWYAEYLRAVALPNVHTLGWRPQSEIGRYAMAFDVCLIPYRTDHPFNRVACPTKVMDYMATTRPVVSTDLPECRLYDRLFDVAADSEEFLDAVGRILARDGDDGQAADRWAAARRSTWERTSGRLLRLVQDRLRDR